MDSTLALKKIEAFKSFPRDLIAGGILGGLAHTFVAPVERAKLVLQTQNSNMQILLGHQRRYKGMFDAIYTIAREEGFWSLWRGNGSGVLRYYPSVALNFAFKDFYRVLISPSDGETTIWQKTGVNFAAGAAAGSTSLFFTYPLDIAHTRLATDVGSRPQFKGLRDFLAVTYRVEGIRGLYQGFPASVHGILVHRSVYFGAFDTAKELLNKEEATLPFFTRWMLAQASTTAAGLVAYPLDTVRHRMMMQSGLQTKMYSSTLDCWRKIYRQEGLASFYKGCLSNMFRGTGAAVILVLYDEVKIIMHKRVHSALDAK